MRKLKLQMQITIDGFIAGPAGEMDWMTSDWDEGLKQHVRDITDPVDCILLGRKLAEGLIPYWASHPQEEGAEKINTTSKIVFTKTLSTSPWENTTLAKGELVEEITKLKKQPGKDMLVYGGANFVSALIRYDLIDDYHLLVDSVAIGKGLPIFHNLTTTQNFKLIKSSPFPCGITAQHYRRREV
ncbi:dihydrofolate reductase family protein [Fulvivirgaceae bacterium PWU5]|uniref:Dihydrofolate reductase family protein n=1 Tax=Dawidia cretensis TaxID=2782350 RepID=A0AAP2GWI1_9BACT|nr:dihydrofolate reductase family protein [Dawidia cretensis]MBT1710667.1 dihydrofolate reductase family protein [Dawidia cretensis]